MNTSLSRQQWWQLVLSCNNGMLGAGSRRKQVRFRIAGDVEIVRLPSDHPDFAHAPHRGSLIDASANGLALLAADLLPVDAEIMIHLSLNSRLNSIRAKVTYCKKQLSGYKIGAVLQFATA